MPRASGSRPRGLWGAWVLPHPKDQDTGPMFPLASPRSERIIVGSNVRPALLPVGRLVEQVWGRDGGRKLLIIAKQPALLQALRCVCVCLCRCDVGGANSRDPILGWGAAWGSAAASQEPVCGGRLTGDTELASPS